MYTVTTFTDGVIQTLDSFCSPSAAYDAAVAATRQTTALDGENTWHIMEKYAVVVTLTAPDYPGREPVVVCYETGGLKRSSTISFSSEASICMT